MSAEPLFTASGRAGRIDRLARFREAIAKTRIVQAILVGDGALASPRPTLQNRILKTRPKWLPYLITFGLAGLITIAGFWYEARIAPTNLAMLYLLVVVVVALRWGRGPAIAAAFVCAVVFYVFFIPPQRTFAIADYWYTITFITLLVVGIVISTLAGEAREQARNARRHEAYTAALYSLSQSLAETTQWDQVIQVIGRHFVQACDWQVVVVLPGERQQSEPLFGGPEFEFGENEREAASWVLKQGHQAGKGTGAFATGDSRFLPLKTSQGIVGALGLKNFDR